MKRYLDYCGAFNGRIEMRANETQEQARQRAERLMQAALDRCKSLASGPLPINIGVDVDCAVVEEKKAA